MKSHLGSSFATPFWLFALGPEDYPIQCDKLGLDKLVALTAEKIQWILESGRHVVLVLPDDFLQHLRNTLPALEGLSMFSYLPYEAFNALHLHAEYAFYWNVVSSSAMHRIIQGLTTFYFRIGHIGEALYSGYEEIVRLFFADCEPVFIDQTKPFDKSTFVQLHEQAEKNAAKILKRLKTLPTSEALVERLING